MITREDAVKIKKKKICDKDPSTEFGNELEFGSG